MAAPWNAGEQGGDGSARGKEVRRGLCPAGVHALRDVSLAALSALGAAWERARGWGCVCGFSRQRPAKAGGTPGTPLYPLYPLYPPAPTAPAATTVPLPASPPHCTHCAPPHLPQSSHPLHKAGLWLAASPAPQHVGAVGAPCCSCPAGLAGVQAGVPVPAHSCVTTCRWAALARVLLEDEPRQDSRGWHGRGLDPWRGGHRS